MHKNINKIETLKVKGKSSFQIEKNLIFNHFIKKKKYEIELDKSNFSKSFEIKKNKTLE